MTEKETDIVSEMTTREKIVWEALRLFSEKGYKGVSVREIAAAVGIKGASIYNHFKGKEEIFHAIFEEMTRQYDKAAELMQIPKEADTSGARVFTGISEEQLQQMAEGLFTFFTENLFAVRFRRMLVTEQYRTEIAAKYYREYFLEAPIVFQTQIFEGIQKNGDFLAYDAKIMALHFYSPVYFLLGKFDAGYGSEECKQLLREHIHTFVQIYHEQ